MPSDPIAKAPDASVVRKPVATAAQVPEPQPQRDNHDTPTNGNAGVSIPLKPLPAALDPQKQSHIFPFRKARPWRNLSRRTLIILAVGTLALLALIIGLAAGLTHRSHTQNLPLPSANGGPYTGDLTYYAPGLGACGVTSTNGDAIVAVSHIIFDAVSVGSDPNQNPLCGKMIRASNNAKASVDLKVVDRCVGCASRDLDVTEDVFAKLADPNLGRVKVQWSWLQGVPGAASGG
ncbi:MAG: hypothetical protein AUG51_20540 [Acidobacteria bacterium 13_1_20CM_3_53_8]|nr:MAG: hypothetical protein AUG51_20540 [Acidobacteria bacterium 13_1_20CM_3_53_8]